jgi:hypothetical protein
VVAGSELVFPVRRLPPDGLEAWKQVIERGYEATWVKDEASVYEGGPISITEVARWAPGQVAR